MCSNNVIDLMKNIENVSPDRKSELSRQLKIQQKIVAMKNSKRRGKPLDTSFLESESLSYTDSVSSERKTK